MAHLINFIRKLNNNETHIYAVFDTEMNELQHLHGCESANERTGVRARSKSSQNTMAFVISFFQFIKLNIHLRMFT